MKYYLILIKRIPIMIRKLLLQIHIILNFIKRPSRIHF